MGSSTMATELGRTPSPSCAGDVPATGPEPAHVQPSRKSARLRHSSGGRATPNVAGQGTSKYLSCLSPMAQGDRQLSTVIATQYTHTHLCECWLGVMCLFLIALIDESVRFDGDRSHYVVAAAIVITDPSRASELIATSLFTDPARTRPFHWVREGVQARENHASLPRHPGGQRLRRRASPNQRAEPRVEARAAVLSEVLLPQLLDVGVTQLIIESRDDHVGGLGPQDARDLRTIRNYLRPWRGAPTFEWHGKEDRLLWTADAAAGAVREHAEGTDSRWMTQLADSGVPVRLTWIGPTGRKCDSPGSRPRRSKDPRTGPPGLSTTPRYIPVRHLKYLLRKARSQPLSLGRSRRGGHVVMCFCCSVGMCPSSLSPPPRAAPARQPLPSSRPWPSLAPDTPFECSTPIVRVQLPGGRLR